MAAPKTVSPLWPTSAMLTAATVTAWASHEWWLVPMGMLASAIFYALLPKRADEIPAGLDHSHRARAVAMLALRDRLLGDLDSAPEVIKENLAVSAMRVRDVVHKFLKLVVKHQEIESYLKSSDINAIINERNRLQRLAAAERDEVARERYLSAVKAKDAQAASQDELRRGVARLDGELATIQANLENVVAQIVRMKSAEARGAFEGESGQVAETLTALTNEIDVVTDTIESVFSAGERTPGRDRVR